jgi:2-methylisocitrate lyase-like PEP mutase family enzyme
MSGFAVSAAYGLPDTGLLTASEMARQGQIICNVLKSIPCIGDGDTVSMYDIFISLSLSCDYYFLTKGYGNAANVHRTVQSYINAGMSGIMIEDQV